MARSAGTSPPSVMNVIEVTTGPADEQTVLALLDTEMAWMVRSACSFDCSDSPTRTPKAELSESSPDVEMTAHAANCVKHEQKHLNPIDLHAKRAPYLRCVRSLWWSRLGRST